MSNAIKLSVVLSLTFLLPAQAPQRASETLRIGTWNLEFLGDPANHRDKLPPRDETDYAAIGRYVRELGVSVLAVQEVCGAAPLAKVAAGAGPSWHALVGTTGGWDDGKTAQNIGFLYDDARVELLMAEELLDFPRQLDDLPIFHRVPVTACFRDRSSGLDFRAVAVHLKASMKADDLRKRKLEATVLRDWLLLLEAHEREDQDIVVLGDFNSTYGTDPETVLEEAGAVRYLRQPQPTPTILHFPEPIDQIAPSLKFGEVRPETYAVHGPTPDADRTAWRKTYSDHFPVTVDLRNNGDDDPDASFSRANPAYSLPAAAGGDPMAEPARGAARAGGQPAPAPAAMAKAAFGAGDSVEIRIDGDKRPIRGTLLGPLGDWVYLQGDDGAVLAIPSARITWVSARAR